MSWESYRQQWGQPSVSLKLNKTTILSHSCPPFNIFVGLLWTDSNIFISFFQEPKTAHSTWDEDASVFTVGQSFQPFSYTTPNAPQDTVGPFGLQVNLIVDSYWAHHLLNSPDPFLQVHSPTFCPPAYMFIQDYTLGCICSCSISRNWWFPSILSRSLCKACLPSRESTAPPSLIFWTDLLCVHSYPVSSYW